MEAPLWSEGASAFVHEREALAFVRSRLPNHEPYRAWTNVEFIADDGSLNEIDLLVVTPLGFFLVEIKSFPGVLTGDGQKWRVRFPDGGFTSYPHPVILTNTKAKRLRSLLQHQKAFTRDDAVPFVTPLVFLSSAELECNLHDIGRVSVTGRDPDPAKPGLPAVAKGFKPLPGIVQVLKDPSMLGLRGTAINKPMSKKLAEAIGQAGIVSSNRGRTVGDWELEDLLDEGPGWQDFHAKRPKLGKHARARIYLAGTATTKDEERRLRKEAEQEYRLINGVRHAGIAHPNEFTQAERGPALIFDYAKGEERLDLWAPDHVGSLPLEVRIDLVRQLCEAVRHAHAHGITHRALTARCVTVTAPTKGAEPQLVIGHWQAGSRELASRLTHAVSTTHATSSNLEPAGAELLDRLEAAEHVYLAPELFTAEHPDGTSLDVFSLGALAYLLLTGQPPATDLSERERLLTTHQSYVLAAGADGLPQPLADLVSGATSAAPANRWQVRDLLDQLDDALDELTRPAEEDADTPTELDVVDPLTAHQGSVLQGGWKVLKRLGSGSTAIALLCEREGANEPEVLKVAKDEEYAERLRDEHRVLEKFNHPGVVTTHGIERIGGRTTLRLTPAGDPNDRHGLTLADRLRSLGRVELDLLERFGDDLLGILKALEQAGYAHRDIKPDNIGVKPGRGDRALHLVLFDFSLSTAADTSLQAGTPGYLDPFLAERKNRRWDPAAERYSAAVTLYEMATGTRPVWGDGRTDPIHLTDQVPKIEAELFDVSVREPLVAFFATALQRDPERRFDNAYDMHKQWQLAFVAAARTATVTDDPTTPADDDALDQLARAATFDTNVAELGLPGTAISTLERLGIGTVRQLLEYPTVRINNASGVGQHIKRQINDAISRLREHLDAQPSAGDGTISIDRLVKDLIPRPTTAQAKADTRPLGMLLGLDQHQLEVMLDLELDGEPVEVDHRAEVTWPSLNELKQRFGVGRSEFDDLLERARKRWAKQPAITQVRVDLIDILERHGGVLPADELALALLAQRGSTATGSLRLQRARAVVRAAFETEFHRQHRFMWRRLAGGGTAVVALTNDDLSGEELADYAASLGAAADRLAQLDPLPGSAAAVAQLREVAPPPGLAPLSDHRLVRLAAAASHNAAVSSRLELYPKGMPADRAVRLARAALLATGTLTENEVRSRVSTRFPDAIELPARPALDTLLGEVASLDWFAGGGPSNELAGYRLRRVSPPASSTAFGSTAHRIPTGSTVDAPDEARSRAEAIQERLTRHATGGGYLVLTVETSKHEQAIAALRDFGPEVISADHLILDAIKAHAEAKKIKWNEAILATDAAGPGSDRWHRLTNVVREALVPMEHDLLTGGHRHVLLVYPGLFARYDRLDILARLREATTRIPVAGQTLETLWVLVPVDSASAAPTIDGKAVSITTSAEHLVLDRPWLANLHRTLAAPPGASA